MMGATRISLAALILAALLSGSASAASPLMKRSGEQGLDLYPGAEIVVKRHKGLGKDVKGRFVAGDAESLIVRLKSGEDIALDWDCVREVRSRKSRKGFWLGLAAGAGIGAAAALTDNGADAGSGWTAAWLGIAGATGAISGEMFDPPSRSVYRAPERESAR